MPQNQTFLSPANEAYVAEMLERYIRDPGLVSEEWQKYFAELNEDATDFSGDRRGASWSNRDGGVVGKSAVAGKNNGGQSLSDFLTDGKDFEELSLGNLVSMLAENAGGAQAGSGVSSLDSIKAIMLIRAYRTIGHREADLDPLHLEQKTRQIPDLSIESFGFSEADLDKTIFINYYLGLESATLREIVDTCRRIYCGKIGLEYQHIQNADEKRWLQERFESGLAHQPLSTFERMETFEQLIQAEGFETYLDKKFAGTKRFGLDGGESLIPMIEALLKTGAEQGLQEVAIGMAHRGRLNVLANVMGKPYEAIFAEFKGKFAQSNEVNSSGDVKYHLGVSSDREIAGRQMHLSLVPNPSHLECVNTVVLGKVRAKQRQIQDIERTQVMGLLLHGDAAFIGQGIVAETFLLSQLTGYRTGGTVHIAINNQIGFTTIPSNSRSSPYCSDMAKTIDAPVFHVNGDDPEACVRVAQIAMSYRQRFKKDIVIDMWCYRRHGHNEGDEPMFTNPEMYQVIAKHPRVMRGYFDYLLRESAVSAEDGEAKIAAFVHQLDQEFAASENFSPQKLDWLEGKWEGLLAKDKEHRGKTGVDIGLLKEVGQHISEIPPNFNAHSKIARQMKARRKMIETGEGIDWGMAEALAFGTLLCESTPIRLSGEDCERGTFSHRHAVVHDQVNYSTITPLNSIRPGQADIEVIDSPLSEFGLLGFEYGYASAEPRSMVIWEAQFGDFANGAQVIIDQFIASSETKWLRMCGLVMLLPHGYEGQGPEHSSARLERYLQLSAEDNWQVCNITSPANFFHALRRQIHRSFRKPLIVMSPKSLLRHKLNTSRLDEFTSDKTFHRILHDDRQMQGRMVADKKITRLVLCSGKVYFDLYEAREAENLEEVYLMRLEQLYPFPEEVLREEIARFPNAEIVWCQEEPQNNGAWEFISPLLWEILAGKTLHYAGRDRAASPATGVMSVHKQQQAALVHEALTGQKI